SSGPPMAGTERAPNARFVLHEREFGHVLLPEIIASRGASLPYPARQVLTGCVLQPGNLVQVVVVQHLAQRLERVGDLGVVDEPAGVRIDLSTHGNLALERVAVESRAFMVLGHARQ